MPLLTIVPPMPGAERRFQPFVDFVHQSCGWETEFVRLEWKGRVPPFGSNEIFPQVDAQTAGKVVLGFSLGALYAHLGALRARHLILGSISPFFLEDDDEPQRWMVSYKAGNPATPADILVGALEDEQMHRRATAVYEFYRDGQRPAADQGRGTKDNGPSTTDHGLLPRSPISEHRSPVSFTDVRDAEHELWHPNYLQGIKTALDRLQAQPLTLNAEG
jgi:hypothetical protein